jgi:hypothetical protein
MFVVHSKKHNIKTIELRFVARILDAAQPKARDASSMLHQPGPSFYVLDMCSLYTTPLRFFFLFHHSLFFFSLPLPSRGFPPFFISSLCRGLLQVSCGLLQVEVALFVGSSGTKAGAEIRGPSSSLKQQD